MIRCGHRTALVDALPTSRTSRPSMSRIRPLIHSRRLRHWAHLAKTASNIPFRCSLLRVATLSPLNRPAAGGDARHLAAAAGGVDGSSSSSRSTRSYLERWAGVHGGTVARSAAAVAVRTPTHQSETRENEPLSGPASFSHATPLPSTATSKTQPLVHFFGRTYLVPTVRVPPLPKSGSASVRDRDSPGWGRVEEEAAGEEGRVFEWMTGMLRGSGALGTTGIVPGAGSPVVLDLGAVSQDGSPHGRPAGRAILAGATRAVRAAGFAPVGVCNTSHDVLKLALEQGLPEVMMVHARSRVSPPLSTPPLASNASATASNASNQRPNSTPECSSNRSPEHGSFTRRRPATPTSPPAPQNNSTPSVSPPGGIPSPPQNGQALFLRHAEDIVPVGTSDVTPSKRDETMTLAREDRAGTTAPLGEVFEVSEGSVGEDGVKEKPEEEVAGERETLVFQGSVRSGQQVYAEGTSLVVIGAVSSGGEVMADGDIHVYGSLRGRALAGLSGNTSAKIFSTRFDAELVGVADTFTTCHDPDNLPGLVTEAPTNVCLTEGNLVFRSFDLSASSINH